ncbi:MAG: FtsX-like permease family protein [Miniphocaeibacter sp.]|uniref:ABC transporter permease n=1 Tax=Miniphocaeibacter sp. TaxID=3100973 RepID=UPI0017FF5CCF|nr:ABC transporter permease [Gallicola sp.]
MKISDLFLTSLKNLWRRKVRTILTIIGVLIGSTSIIIMLSMGFALTKNNEAMFEEIGGLSAITVHPSDSMYAQFQEEQTTKSKNVKLNNLTINKLQAIEGVKLVVPFMEFKGESPQILKGKLLGWGQVYGVDFNHIEEIGYKITSGHMPTGKYDALAGVEVGNGFYNPNGTDFEQVQVDLLNDKVDFGLVEYDEKGNFKIKSKSKINFTGLTGTEGSMYSYQILIGMDYFKELATEANKKAIEKEMKTDLNNYSLAMVQIEDGADLLEVQNAIKAEGFITESNADFYNEIKEGTDSTRMMFLIVGAVAFIVAAIGIANTMIMSVYERTKEIGVMKVIGASIKDIRNMFLMEATFIGLIGGIISIFFSYLVSFLLNSFGTVQSADLFYMEETSKLLVSYIPFWLPFIGVIFSTLVGLFSGYIPARRATKISAIEAIRNQ